MANGKLESRAALNGYSSQYDGVGLSEVVNSTVYSVACNESEQSAVNDNLAAQFGAKWPTVGGRVVSSDSSLCVLGLQRDQIFIVLNDASRLDALKDAVSSQAWYTDQSDSWVTIRVSGERRYDLLERTCPIDLAPEVCTENHVARTSMEHIGIII